MGDTPKFDPEIPIDCTYCLNRTYCMPDEDGYPKCDDCELEDNYNQENRDSNAMKTRRIDISEDTIADLGYLRSYLEELSERETSCPMLRRAADLADKAGDAIYLAWRSEPDQPSEQQGS